MEFAKYCPEWLDILKQQDEILRVEKLTAD